jgi:lipopolysaccharide/colanic/teichoic acid biosynthesis glycosyltransferase
MKRTLDIVVAALASLTLSWLLLFLIWRVRSKLGSPVFFTQVRAGKHGRPFKMVKFRSMTCERGTDGQLLPDSVRLTPFGRWLRSTSLDELPELWNVMKGDMSLVGPRPLVMEYLPLYSTEQARRHEVRPGITGWAQINGRNALSWEEKFKLDLWYVKNHTLWIDIKILALTVIAVAAKKGISPGDQEIMERFLGSRDENLSQEMKGQ